VLAALEVAEEEADISAARLCVDSSLAIGTAHPPHMTAAKSANANLMPQA